MRYVRCLTSLAAVLVVVAGCVTKPVQPPGISHFRSTKGDELAAINIATVLVWPWDDVSHDLQPVFKIVPTSPQSAIAVTSSAGSQYSRNSLVSFGIVAGPNLSPLAQSQLSASKTDKPDPPSAPASASTAKKDQPAAGAGDAAKKGKDADSQSSTPSEADASSPGKGNAPAGSTLALSDAITQLQTTNALYQEAGLLNNFVGGFIQRLDYIPYIVRMQLAVLPLHRQEPYDLFVSLDLSLIPQEKPVATPSPVNTPLIVAPLLVTDSIEEAQESIASQIGSQLAAGASAGIGAAQLSAQLQNAVNRLNSSLSNRPNSLFSIAKKNFNSLLIRIGANRFGDDYELQPRTHSVSFVILVHRSLFSIDKLSTAIQVDAKPVYRDALVGDPLMTAGDVEGSAARDTFVLEANPASVVNEDSGAADGAKPGNASPAKSAAQGSGKRISDIWCPADQLIAVTDSEDGALATVYGVRDWGKRTVYGYLQAVAKDDPDGAGLTFASETTVRGSTGVVPLRFPSLAPALSTKKPMNWSLYLLIDKLRTDISYSAAEPWIGCQSMNATILASKPATPKGAAVVAKVTKPAAGKEGPVATQSLPKPNADAASSPAARKAPVRSPAHTTPAS